MNGQQSKRIVIMVGLPGSGKSTVAQRIAAQDPAGSVIVSADDCPGRYDFNSAGDVIAYHPEVPAHPWCEAQVLEAMTRGARTIIVDNTSLLQPHRDVYTSMATANGYRALLCWVGDGGCCDAVLSTRGRHGVPVDKVAMMRSLLL